MTLGLPLSNPLIWDGDTGLPCGALVSFLTSEFGLWDHLGE